MTTEASRIIGEIFGPETQAACEAEERACWIPQRVIDALNGYHPDVFGTMRRNISLQPDARPYKQYAQTACRLTAVLTLDADDYYRLGRVARGGNWRD